MRKMLLFLAGVLFSLAGFTGIWAEEKKDEVYRLNLKVLPNEPVQIVEPFDHSIHYEDTASVVIQIDPKKIEKLEMITHFQVFELDPDEEVIYKKKKKKIKKSKEKFNFKLKDNKAFYCKSIDLRYGRNLIQVIAKTKDGKTIKKQVEIYLASPILRAYKYPPPKYKEIFFHTEKNEKVCSQCHDMTVNEKKGVAFEDVTKSNCYVCHKKLTTRYEYNHAPARNWLCATTCHTGKTGRLNKRLEGKSKFIWPEPQGPECYRCHKEKREEWDNKRFHHDPVVAGMCDKCHNPHASPNRYFLRKPSWYLCTTCHEDKVLRGHVVFTFLGRPHPTKGFKDPSNPKRELSCISCHEAHNSDHNFMLLKPFYQLCNMCHKK
ncbi:cytochrome c3 family protein [Persephonella sp.]